MRTRKITAVSFLLLSQLAFAQEGLQPIPRNQFQLQPTPLPIRPIRVGEPTPAKRPAPALPLTLQAETASFTEPVSSNGNLNLKRGDAKSRALADKDTATTLLKRSLALSANRVEGSKRQISLREALDRAVGRGQQMDAVKSYWRLFAALADYNHGWEESNFLSRLPMPQARQDQVVLRSFQSAARARLDEANLALVAAQGDLTTSARLSEGDELLPSDPPYAGAYRTRFDSLFGGRNAPEEIRRIHRTLPHQLTLIYSRATAVVDAETALAEIVDGYESGSASLRAVLDGLIQLRDQRIAFLAITRDYNQAIANYALNVTAAGLSRDRVVSMLIDRRSATRSGRPARASIRCSSHVPWRFRRSRGCSRRGPRF